MPFTIYRVTRTIYPVFDGAGAFRWGARWTSPGRTVIYAAGSYAGALLEVLARTRQISLDASYHAVAIGVPDDVHIERLQPDQCTGWDAPNYVVSRSIGDRWIETGRSAILHVPSVTGQPHETNVLINPTHPDTKRLHVGAPHPVVWDPRLIQSQK